jgi:hypothetical protein
MKTIKKFISNKYLVFSTLCFGSLVGSIFKTMEIKCCANILIW